MFASQLLKILQTIPSDEKYETCVFAAEQDKTMNPLVFEVKGRNENWNPFLDDENETREDQNRISYNPISLEKAKPKLKEFTHCDENESRSLYIAASDLFEKNKDLFTDKIVLECDPPEVIVRYKEVNYHIVKDICVDEGMPLKDNFVIDLELFESAASSLDDTEGVSVNNIGSKDETDDKSESPSESSFETKPEQIPDQISSGKAASEIPDVSSPEAGPKEDVQADSLYKRENITFDFNSSTQVVAEVKTGITENEKERSIDSEKVLNHKDEHADHNSDSRQVHFKSKDKSIIEQTREIEENKFCDDFQGECAINDNLNDENVHDESPGHKDENCDDISSIGHGRNFISDGQANEPCVCEHEHRDTSDDQAVSQVKCEGGESSFSAASLITYTGPIAHSGSLSVRSDSSATSARSFAFPILQSEWNSSPVRMTNADGTHLRRHKGWRSGLLCCRF